MWYVAVFFGGAVVGFMLGTKFGGGLYQKVKRVEDNLPNAG